MANFFYYDASGKKLGPVNDQMLRVLVKQEKIHPNTPLETDGGHKGLAGQIPGLFPAAPAPFAQTAPVTPSAASLFCTNCGNPVSEHVVACMSCGASPIGHRKFCRRCGVGLNPEQIVCVRCGSGVSTVPATRSTGNSSPKNKMVAALLAFFLGAFGIHKFYLGQTTEGIVFLCVAIFTLGFGAIITGILAFINMIQYLMMSDEDFAAKYP